jgi:hypothetical protein
MIVAICAYVKKNLSAIMKILVVVATWLPELYRSRADVEIK